MQAVIAKPLACTACYSSARHSFPLTSTCTLIATNYSSVLYKEASPTHLRPESSSPNVLTTRYIICQPITSQHRFCVYSPAPTLPAIAHEKYSEVVIMG